MLTKDEFLKRHSISTKPKPKPKTAGMSSPNAPSSPRPIQSVFDMQFDSLPLTIPRPRARSAPVNATINADYNPQQPCHGSLSGASSSATSSSYDGFPPNESLIHHRIDLLNIYQGHPRIQLIQHEINPDSGELYGDDVTPPAKKRDVKPPISREQQRLNVAKRLEERRSRHRFSLSEAGELLRDRMIRLTNLQLAAHNALIDEAAAIKAREEQAQADIATAASGDLTNEQQAQLDILAHIQQRAASHDGNRQKKLLAQRAGLAEQAALLNAASLSGLGLELNPDFTAAYSPSADEEDELTDTAIAALETMEEATLAPICIPAPHLPSSAFSAPPSSPSASASHPPRPRTPSPITPVVSTAAVTHANPHDSYQIAPANPAERARGLLTRAANGQTTRERSVAEGLREAMRGAAGGGK